MKRKLVIIAFLVSALTLSVMADETYAFDRGKKKGHDWNLEDKFSHKIHLILSNREELGLSDEQMNNVKDLKTKTKKDLIRANAEIDILALDVKSEMDKDLIDANAVNKLIDKKYDLKKEKAKSLVGAFAALKGILTKEQKNKMKELWKKCEKQEMQCPMMEGKMECPMMSGKT